MAYFVTGGTGFIGKRLVQKLLQRPGSIVYFLILERERGLTAPLLERWGVDASRAIAVIGDISLPALGIDDATIANMRGKIAHMFHLAAVYDLNASAEAQQIANVEGTRNAIAFAAAVEAGCFHITSSIASAGLYEGVFREDMFDEAEHLEHPYFRTKHESEGIVRHECARPWRIYRPGIVVGDSRTGEMDKIDGPYYFFKLIQKLRRILPPWFPAIGIEGGRLNLVPVDFVVAAIDHIAHLPGRDGQCFHLTDPEPKRVGDVLDIFARAAHAPPLALRINPHLFDFIPASVRHTLAALTVMKRIRGQLMRDLGLPPDIWTFVNYPTRFDCREAQRALAGSGIAVPRLEEYAEKLWDYWERHLDPELFIDRSLAGAVRNKVVLITGASSGIGKAVALKVSEAGGKVVAVAREDEQLAALREEFAGRPGIASIHACDLAELDQVDALVQRILGEYGSVDILINNAGKSIRRAIENSFDRFHDFQRCMQLNYFGTLRLTLGLLPAMVARRRGHVINISSIGVLTNAPRFSAYVASKAAMEAFTGCAASEFADHGIAFTTINMPLVRTRMIAPTKFYQQVPMLEPEQAADLVAQAIVFRPERIATRLGIFGAIVHAVAPKLSHLIMNIAFRTFPESASSTAAAGALQAPAAPSADQLALMQVMRGIHL
jgi:NAD(P)-dependent dehydrogenase (short-subunit alcohol dehydrogenase family)